MSNSGNLPNTAESSGDSLLDAATLEYLHACEAGNPPDPEEFLNRYPQYADELREFFIQREEMDELVGPIVGFRDLLGPNHLATDEPVVFGDYELLKEIGRGGMGVIYEARHQKLKRVVALKMISGHGSGDAYKRFQAEAETAATLEHPNIVPIYEVGNHDNRPYFTMKLIGGGSLKEPLSDGPMDSRLAAEAACSIAEAIHYAHQRGVLHRDLKPANILIDNAHSDSKSDSDKSSNNGLSDSSSIRKLSGKSSGSDSSGRSRRSIVPMISDFGLAKRLDQDDGFTMTGAVLGTPSFMSPEQAIGSGANSTIATDIYGIGAILYNMLTGSPPFVGQTQLDITRKVIRDTPDSIRKINTNVDLDLETICLKCLEKSPEHRYLTADLLADDLSRYLEGKPILARRSGSLEQFAKWVRRKPAIASLLFVVATSAIVMMAVLFSSNRAIRSEQSRTLEALADVRRQRTETQQALWQAHLNEAKGHRESKNGGHQAASLTAIRKAAKLSKDIHATEEQQVALRSEYIADLALPVDIHTVKHFSGKPVGGSQLIVSFDDSLETMSSIDDNHVAVQFDVETGKELRRLPLNVLYQAQLSPDGEFLVADENGTGELFFCLASGEGPITKTGVQRNSRNFCFSTDSELLFVADKGGLHVFELSTGKKLRRLPLPFRPNWLACNLDVTRFVVTNEAGSLLVMNIETGEPILRREFDTLGQVDFSPDGQRLAVAGGYSGNVMVIDLKSGRQIMEFKGKSRFMYQVFFDASGKYVLGCNWNNATRIWDVRSGELVLNVPGTVLGMSRTNNRLALRRKSEVRICELRTSPLFWHERGHEMGRKRVLHVSFHPQLPLAVSGGQDGVRIVNTESRNEVAFLPIGEVTTALFHPVDGSMVTWGRSRLLRWPLRQNADGEWAIGPFEKLPDPGGWPDELSISRNGKSLAATVMQKAGFVIDWNDRSRFQQLGQHGNVSRVSVSPDGKSVATGNWKGEDVSVWDAGTGELRKKIKLTGGYAFPKHSPCGRYLAIATFNETILYHADSFEPFGHLPTTRSIPAFTPDGSSVAIVGSSGDRAIEMYDVVTQKRLANLTETPERMISHSLTFGPHGRLLAKPCAVQGISFWRLDRIRSELAASGIDWKQDEASHDAALALDTSNPPEITSIKYRPYAREEEIGEEFAIDLTDHTSHPMSENLLKEKEGYCFEQMPRGWVDLEGVHFQIADELILLKSAEEKDPDQNVTEPGDSPDEKKESAEEEVAVRDIAVGQQATKLHFLHNLIAYPGSKLPVRYVMHYEDGTTNTFQIKADEHIGYCRYSDRFASLGKSKVAWAGETSNHDPTNLVRTTWTSPSPDKKIKKIDIVLADEARCQFVCLAITGER